MGAIKDVEVTECTCTAQNSPEVQCSFKGSSLGEGSEEALKFRGQTLERWYCRKGEKPAFYLVILCTFNPL